MRALVADDEEPARRRLIRQLLELGGIEVVGEAADGLEVLAKVRSAQPDALFLDVRMPELDGIGVASRGVPLPPIVFTTAHDEFAVRAFEVEAVDYLLKPIALPRLLVAVERIRHRMKAESAHIVAAAHTFGGQTPAVAPRVTSLSRGSLHFFDVREISRFYALDKYTAFMADGQEQLTQESLGALEERLCAYGFLRVHRGELANLARVRALQGVEGSHELVFLDGQRARVSRRFAAVLKKALRC
jgi:two-component system LytT family response regulator